VSVIVVAALPGFTIRGAIDVMSGAGAFTSNFTEDVPPFGAGFFAAIVATEPCAKSAAGIVAFN
jgi:hypothetical protein